MVENKDQSENLQEKEKFVRVDWRLTGWGEIPCEIHKGLFPQEFFLVIRIGEEVVQLWADKDWVEQERDKDGWMKVRVVREEEENLLINLPNETLFSGSRIFVPKTMIRGLKIPKSLIQEL